MPGLGELCLVLLQRLLRFPLGLFGALQAALDLVGPLRQRLLDPWQQHPPQEREDDRESERTDDQLREVGEQRVGVGVGGASKESHRPASSSRSLMRSIQGPITCSGR